MYFNASRAHQFAFDRVASAYDDARPRFDSGLVAELAEAGGLAPGDAVYEIGAGTGQLTHGLLEYGFTVTANEPGANMRDQLAQITSDRLEIHALPFEEDAISPHRYAAVFAANSFHWIRPEVAFERVSEIVRPDGALCLLWNFSFLDPRLQAHLNGSAFAKHDDLIQSPDLKLDDFAQVMAAGRELIAASGWFTSVAWDWRPVVRTLSPETYADLAVSYASTAALSDDAHLQLRANIIADLDACGISEVTITDHVYLCTARTLAIREPSPVALA